MPTPDGARVVAVVVTYNRAELLAECLTGLAQQDRPADAVVVIDNCSTDGSGDVARNHPIGADLVSLTDNVGGAGGFAAGMARALSRHRPDWLWLMDDDTIPGPAALRGLLEVIGDFPHPVTALSSTAVWTDGRIHPMNVSRERLGTTAQQRARADQVDARVIRTASFVAFFVSAQACREHGLPHADYFIWGDDTEYSGRVLRHGIGLQVAGSVVEHRTKAFGSWQNDPGERFYYEVRNKIWAFARSGSFTLAERLLYGGSAALGWLRTVARSKNRRLLLARGARGLRDGVLRVPKPTVQVLSGMGEISDDVVAALGAMR